MGNASNASTRFSYHACIHLWLKPRFVATTTAHVNMTILTASSPAQAVRPSAPSRVNSTRVHAYVDANVKGPFQVKEDVKVLFRPLQLGAMQLNHRVVMAPLTRCRSPNNIPGSNVGLYYSQRASPGGMIITEGTVICPEGHGTPNVPGIHTKEQVEAWKPIVHGVKKKGCNFVMQLWHQGRASHQDFQPDGALPYGPSAIPVGEEFECYTSKGGPFKYPTPRALEESEIPGVVEAFATAAKNAREAGFDGVEIHGANGYLLDQFWKDSSNKRTDGYGGSVENQGRLMVEVCAAVAGAIGADRTGQRLSPYNSFLSAQDSVERAIDKNVWLMKELDAKVPGMAYIHMVEPRLAGGNAEREVSHKESLDYFKEATSRPFLAAGGLKRDSATKAVEDGKADAVVFGRYFISNPDLPKRIAEDAPFHKYDRDTFYTFDEAKGYTDYPFLGDESHQQQEGDPANN